MRIVLVDNHILFREGLSGLLQNQPDIEVVGEAGSASEAVARVFELKPDVVLIDITPQVNEGLNAIKTMVNNKADTKIIVLAHHDTDEMLINSLRYGAKGFLLKNSHFEVVLRSIRAVERGEAALSRRMTRRILDEFCSQEESGDPVISSLDKLTARELEIFGILTSGITNRKIAEELFISENTVKVHVHNILDKLQLRNRREVAKFAHLQGLEFSVVTNAAK
ncbi:MAG: response regulator transcription factor [Candidatus Bathyarchaeia archaeon]